MSSHFLHFFDWILFIFAGNEDMMRPLVSMATDRVTVGKQCHHISRTFLIGFISYLQVMMIYIRALMSSKFGEIRPWTTLERLKKIP